MANTPRTSGVFNLGALGGDGTGAVFNYSLQFDGSADYLSRTVSASNRKTWTFSAWLKKTDLTARDTLFSGGTAGDANNLFYVQLEDNTSPGATSYRDNNLKIVWREGSTTTRNLTTTATFKNTTEWVHLVLALDTTQTTASDKMKLYIDGAEVTGFAVDDRSTIATNDNLPVNAAGSLALSAYAYALGSAERFKGQIAEVHFIDGQALDATYFGETSNSQWVPKKVTGVTYGTNGFHLDFEDNSTAAALGTDATANGNDFTVTGLSTGDRLNDVPLAATTTRPTRRWGGMTGRSLVESTAAVAGDANWNDVTLLLDGSSSTDLSPASPTITPSTSAPTAGNSGGRVGGQYIDFNGSNNYYNVALNQAIGSSGDPFTVECWVYFDAHSNDGVFQILRSGSTLDASADSNTVSLAVAVFNNQWVVYDDTGGNQYGSSVATGTWHHVALVYDGSDLVFYLNGAAAITKSNWTANLSSTGYPNIAIGGYYSTGFVMDGRIQDFRVTKGVARDIAAGFSNGTPISGGGWDAAFPTNQAVAASTNVPTTGVLSLAEHYQGTL